ncbi:MmyB family transcriptional regulator [Streptomyces puniciscabiei]
MAFLRVGVGRCPDDPALACLIGTLAMKSEEFAALWARQDVADKGPGRYTLRHPLVGPLTLDFEVLATNAPGQVLVSCLPALETEAAQALELIGSWGPAGA